MEKEELIYLALPYIHSDPIVMDFRADVSDIIAADLSNRGHSVFAPISSWHHVAKKYGLPRDWTYWYKLDEMFVGFSTKVLVITLDGWKQSTGVHAEMELANDYDTEIDYIDPEPYVEKLKKEGKYNDAVYQLYGRTDYLKKEM